MARIGRPLMSMHAAPTPEHALTRWLLTCGVLLVSAFVLADEMARLETPRSTTRCCLMRSTTAQQVGASRRWPGMHGVRRDRNLRAG